MLINALAVLRRFILLARQALVIIQELNKSKGWATVNAFHQETGNGPMIKTSLARYIKKH